MMFKKAVSKLFTTHKSDTEIYHDLMHFKVREILLVATVYDAFILEREGKLTELIFGEYHQLNLSIAPRVTSVPFGEQALEKLEKHRYDMVILTMRIDEMTPFELGQRIKERAPKLPVLLLLNDDHELALLSGREEYRARFDRVFIWNGDAKVLLAMIKYVEDRVNVREDTRIGLVRVILLVEDSIQYYSRYLPLLHTQILKQTHRLIGDENLVEIHKLLRMRTRPKVLLAETYEEAMATVEEFRDYMLCVISDVKFSHDGKLDERAGIKLVQQLKDSLPSMPILLQSSDPEYAKEADRLGVAFLNKNADDLSRELTGFINFNLGFGDFVFRDETGREIASAKSMAQFRSLLRMVPDESLIYHSNRNHFSSWLMARGEIQIAKFMQPLQVSDFASPADLRDRLIELCAMVHKQKTRGRIILYDETVDLVEEGVVRLSHGSIGGKGRGMVFLNMLVENQDLFQSVPEINVQIPETAIVATEEYDYFMDEHGFRDLFGQSRSFEQTERLAVAAELSPYLRDKLRAFLETADYPLAVRSSSLFEDSISQPFSGIYKTYFLPNRHPDVEVRAQLLEEAIKLVFASVYSDSSRSYLDAIHYKIAEEKMAVLIQRVVGNDFGDRFYPHLAGVAQSYNYYPVSYLKPEDGVAVIGMGLGLYVVDGERAWRFCPKHPRIEFLSQEDIVRNSQDHFYAIDLGHDHEQILESSGANLLTLPIGVAEEDGAANSMMSVYDPVDEILRPGLANRGPRVVNFASILKHDAVPFAPAIDCVLEVVKSSMGMPVQIEFAMDLRPGRSGKPTLYILQIKPLIGDFRDCDLDLEAIPREQLLLQSSNAMGNGVIQEIRDIVFVDLERFDKSRTVEMAAEIEGLNRRLRDENKRYVLLGPGRWGSRDRWLGIPVRWPDISNAKIIVEVELEDFRFDASLGSHFFHNVTSQGVGYFSVSLRADGSGVDWDWLQQLPEIGRTKHFRHVRSPEPLCAKMDGRKGCSVILKRRYD